MWKLEKKSLKVVEGLLGKGKGTRRRWERGSGDYKYGIYMCGNVTVKSTNVK
jgi:hypothetical protein